MQLDSEQMLEIVNKALQRAKKAAEYSDATSFDAGRYEGLSEAYCLLEAFATKSGACTGVLEELEIV
jgi:hypothetical protein